MRKYFGCLLIILVLVSPLLSESSNINMFNNAIPMPVKNVEIGLFGPVKYSCSDNLEVAVHPIAFFLSPNFQVKHFFKTNWHQFHIASHNKINFPTPLLKMISREGTGGIIAKEFRDDIPIMFSIYNGLIGCRNIKDNHLLNLKVGFNMAINANRLDSRTTIDLPVVYPRLQVFYEGFGLHYGVGITSHIFGRLFTTVETEIFHYPTSAENLCVEIPFWYSMASASNDGNEVANYVMR
jgi:hypothetical protein